MHFIDLSAQQEQVVENDQKLRDKINEAIKKVLDHGKYILGPEVNKLEKLLADYVGVKHCIALSSGTDALLVALMAIGVKENDEVITTPFSFISTAETIAQLNAIPVFVDINPLTYNLEPKNIEAAITSKTKAILPVSLYGQPADFQKINAIAEKYNLSVIEDGAQSFGSMQKSKKSCSLSLIGTTSFFPSKPLGCYGDGGACFTDDDLLASKIRSISCHGQIARYNHKYIGINGRIDTLQAAILIEKMKLFPLEVKKRMSIANRYTNELNRIGINETPFIEEGNTSVFAQYTIKLDNRDNAQRLLNDSNIPTSIHYPTPLHKQLAILDYLDGHSLAKDLTVSENLSNKVISLPMHPWLKIEEQDKVIEALAKINS